MPNHVYNSLEFTGSTNNLFKIIKKFSAPNMISDERKEFNFHNLISPSDIDWYNTDDNWYDWNIANWGTKWNAYDVDIEDKIDSDHPYLSYSFTTAWSPPTNVILALTEFIVDRKIHVNMDWYYEEEQGWGGKMHYDPVNGLYCVEEWDIPSSHEELVDRHGNCYCNEDCKPFDDCPSEETNE